MDWTSITRSIGTAGPSRRLRSARHLTAGRPERLELAVLCRDCRRLREKDGRGVDRGQAHAATQGGGSRQRPSLLGDPEAEDTAGMGGGLAPRLTHFDFRISLFNPTFLRLHSA